MEFTGKTVQEAIENGLKEMNLEESKAEIKVLEEPTKGFLGIAAKKAKVDITVRKTDGERAVEFLNGLLDLMNVNAKSNLTEEDEKVSIDIITDNSSAIIGYRGEVLDALQSLAGAVANTGRDDYRRVVVDCESYREKREETLVSLARKLEAKAVRMGRKINLEPMNPYERRILHSALADSADVKTLSEGKEPNRYVSIIPNNLTDPDDKGISERRFSGNQSGNNRNGSNDRSGKFRKGGREDRGGRSYGNSKRGGFNGGRRDSAPRQPRPKTSGFGTFLGNSLKEGDKS
mgnify:CR=1 FL=1